MIVVVASVRNGAAQDLLAANLAVLRAREGRSICLLDTDPRRVRCRSRSRTCSSAMPTS
jgi:Mrp family chromosome partitioning ATPase